MPLTENTLKPTTNMMMTRDFGYWDEFRISAINEKQSKCKIILELSAIWKGEVVAFMVKGRIKGLGQEWLIYFQVKLMNFKKHKLNSLMLNKSLLKITPFDHEGNNGDHVMNDKIIWNRRRNVIRKKSHISHKKFLNWPELLQIVTH